MCKLIVLEMLSDLSISMNYLIPLQGFVEKEIKTTTQIELYVFSFVYPIAPSFVSCRFEDNEKHENTLQRTYEERSGGSHIKSSLIILAL